MYRARAVLGGDANTRLLGEIAQLRREYAQLFGFASYADFTLRRRMAENTANTQRFLDEVKAVLTERELRDIAELKQAKAQHLGTPLSRRQHRALGRVRSTPSACAASATPSTRRRSARTSRRSRACSSR
jgi:Zn-dependent oligopeptidase